jgi:hypothetical protein
MTPDALFKYEHVAYAAEPSALRTVVDQVAHACTTGDLAALPALTTAPWTVIARCLRIDTPPAGLGVYANLFDATAFGRELLPPPARGRAFDWPPELDAALEGWYAPARELRAPDGYSQDRLATIERDLTRHLDEMPIDYRVDTHGEAARDTAAFARTTVARWADEGLAVAGAYTTWLIGNARSDRWVVSRFQPVPGR